MDAVAHEVRTAFRSVRKRGVEAGGILFGARMGRGDSATVFVESAEKIECEHRTGPSFVLSEPDRERLAAQIARMEAEGRVVVGCYRSRTRAPGDSMPIDAAGCLLEACGLRSGGVFLMVHPASVAGLEARLLVWDGEGLAGPNDFAPFPFADEPEPLPDVPPRRPRTDPATGRLAPGTAIMPRRPMTFAESREPAPSAGTYREPVPILPASAGSAVPARSAIRSLIPKRSPRRALWAAAGWLWMVFFAILGSLAGYEIVSRSLSEPPAGTMPASMGLDAKTAGGDIVLHWDTRLPALARAARGDIEVDDGSEQSDYSLSRDDLQSGTFTYTPQNAGVTFVLDAVDAHGRAGRESIVFVSAQRPHRRARPD
jgi:hypothetical protein